MQSWGGPFAGDNRPSFDVPTCSGVVGLVAGALGIRRTEPSRLAELADSLLLVVRVDAAGSRAVDFHTSENVPSADGKLRKDPVVSRRSYLYDASFAALLVEWERPPITLEDVIDALRHPRFTPYLGRKTCAPALPVLAVPRVLEGTDWEALLAQVPVWPATRSGQKHDVHVDARLAPERTERAMHLRDVPARHAPRFFDERTVHPVLFDRARHTPTGSARQPTDTVTPWFR